MPQPEVIVALLSDQQVGQKTRDFSWEIYQSRMLRWADTLVRLKEIHSAEREIPELVIADLGDCVQGEPSTGRVKIDELDVIDNRPMDVVTQKRLVVENVTLALAKLSMAFGKVSYYAVPGNHGMGRGKFASMRANDDTEVQLAIAQNALRFGVHCEVETNTFWKTIGVNGMRFLLVHGHQVNMWQNVPHYGIMRKVAQWHQVLPEEFDAVLMGHFHTGDRIHSYRTPVYVNGAFASGSDYELDKGLIGCLEQWVLGVHPRVGISWERRVRLDG